MPIHKKRDPDYKITGSENKSLHKSRDKYSPDKDGERFGGFGGALGPTVKMSKAEEKKQYYLANHGEIEYFAMEILSQIGLNATKARFLQEKTSTIIATNAAIGYIPMTALLDLSYYRDRPIPAKLKKINDQFRLDAKNQVIKDIINNKEYKISGNLFAANIGAILVQDNDFQPEGLNLGVVKRGNRYFAFLIDKDMCSFNGKVIKDLSHFFKGTISRDVFANAVTDVASQEQKLFIANEIDMAIKLDEKGSSAIEKIFLNPRVENTKITFTIEQRKKYVDDLQKTGKSIVEHYTDGNPDFLIAFRAREKIRAEIAEEVINNLLMIGSNLQNDKEALKDIIMEDLRAPYYKEFFTNHDQVIATDQHNSRLVNAIVSDQIEELLALEIFTNPEVENYKKNLIGKADVKLSHALTAYIEKELNRPIVKITVGYRIMLEKVLSELNTDELFDNHNPKNILDIIDKMDKAIINKKSLTLWVKNETTAGNWEKFKEQNLEHLKILRSNLTPTKSLS